MADLVDITRSDDGTFATITLANPPLNIITPDVRSELLPALEELHADASLRVVVITGDGDRAFCAGADLGEEAELTPETVRDFVEEDRRVYDDVQRLAVPTIAAINGHCMGGGFELALACDLRLAKPGVKFCAPGVKLGLVVGPARLTRLAGPAVASDLVLTGRTFLAEEAHHLQLVSQLTEDVKAESAELASTIASRAPLATRRAKQSIDVATREPFWDALDEELEAFVEMTATEDHKRAVAAFFNKEEVHFEGR